LRRTCVSLSSSLAGFFQVARLSSIAYASLTKSAIWEPFFASWGADLRNLFVFSSNYLSSVVLGSELASAAAAMAHACLLQGGIWSEVDLSGDLLA
jgi:hypothetical protein